jgi:peptide/nickel transport system substrate-binding protein
LTLLSIGALGVALAASGCTTNSNTTTNQPTTQIQTGLIDYNAADSTGPAAPVTGATTGGTLTILEPTDFDHMDPARSYVNVQQVIGTLITRSLTTYQETVDSSGKVTMKIVGDMATGPGTDVNKDCKTWKYTLKDGLKFEDGTPVTSKDVAYGIARSFSSDLSEGPHYIQNWLAGTGTTSADYNKNYNGPYNGASALPPNLTTPDNKTLLFSFSTAQCDMPFAAALPMTAAVPQAQDTKLDYDKHPISDGPYMYKSYTPGVSLDLVRNPNWDPATDAVHHAYPDAINFSFGLDGTVINQRLLANASADQASMTWTNIDSATFASMTSTDKARTVDGATQFADYLNINVQRISDLTTRKAINTALDKNAVLLAIGGALAGTVLNTIESPTTAGWKDYNIFGVGPTGDSAKASALLAGDSSAQKNLTLCYPTGSQRRLNMALAIQASLQKAGFTVTLKTIPGAQYYTELGKKDVACDIFRTGWGSDWPSGSTIIPPLLDGRSIQPTGNQDYSYFNDATVNAQIDKINGDPASKAADEWAALDQTIMQNFAPLVPLDNSRNYTLDGSKIGGAFLSSAFGATSLNDIYIKTS